MLFNPSMGEACLARRGNPAVLPAPGALAIDAWQLETPFPFERPHVLRGDAAQRIDGLLARVARGRGALDVAIGEGLATLARGDRALRLGYSGMGDYARERLGIAGRTAQAMARLARELRERPLLRSAVRSGEVTARKAQAVLPLARGQAEEEWVERARTTTVRALEAAVRATRGGDPEDAESDWERIWIPLAPEAREKLDEAMALAGKVLGAASPEWQRLEAICQAFLGAHPAEAVDDGAEVPHAPVVEWLESAKEALEAESRLWAYLEAL